MSSGQSASDGTAQRNGSGDPTVIESVSRTDRVVLFVGLPALGVLLAFGLPPVARWALSWDVALPVRPVFRIVGAVDRPWEIAINVAIWLVIGLVAAATAAADPIRLTLTDSEIRIERGARKQAISRAEVAAVFLDNKTLVVQDRESRQPIREIHEVSGSVLVNAFRERGYPWRDADPYADRYRRWVPATPELPAVANDVLTARAAALKKKAGAETRDLRNAVEKLGYVVRDEGSEQYWRPLIRP